MMIILTFPLFRNVLKFQLIVATLTGCKWCKYVDTCIIHYAGWQLRSSYELSPGGGVTQFNVVIVSRLTWDNATVLHCERQDTARHTEEH